MGTTVHQFRIKTLSPTCQGFYMTSPQPPLEQPLCRLNRLQLLGHTSAKLDQSLVTVRTPNINGTFLLLLTQPNP